MTDTEDEVVEREAPEAVLIAYIDAKKRLDDAKAEIADLRPLIEELFPAEDSAYRGAVTRDGVPVMKFDRIEYRRINGKKLREDYPDIAHMYESVSYSFRLELMK